MKYNIYINQFAVYNNFGLNLDLTDMAIYDFCKHFIKSENRKIKKVTIKKKI